MIMITIVIMIMIMIMISLSAYTTTTGATLYDFSIWFPHFDNIFILHTIYYKMDIIELNNDSGFTQQMAKENLDL